MFLSVVYKKQEYQNCGHAITCLTGSMIYQILAAYAHLLKCGTYVLGIYSMHHLQEKDNVWIIFAFLS